MKRLGIAGLLTLFSLVLMGQAIQPGGSGGSPCSAFGTTAGTCAQGGVVTAAGPTGSGTAIPVITYNAAGQLTTVTTAVPSVTSQIVNTSYDLTTASGTQTIPFTFTPSTCDGFGAVTNTAITQYTTFNSHIDSAGTQSLLYLAASQVDIASTYFFIAENAAGNGYQLGAASFGVNSLIITWTKTGSPTGTFTESIRCFK